MTSTALAFPLFFVSHYHAVSARLRFLVEMGEEGMRLCSSLPIPPSATLRRLAAATDAMSDPAPASAALHGLCERLTVESGALEIVKGFALALDADAMPSTVLLARSTAREPFTAPEGMAWIELPESRRLPPVQQNLLRAAYEHYHESTSGGGWMEP